MTVMHTLSAACFAGIAAAVLGSAAWFFRAWFQTVASWGIGLSTGEPAGFLVRGAILAIALWLVLAPIAVYLVTAED
jgi:hypothetical protein